MKFFKPVFGFILFLASLSTFAQPAVNCSLSTSFSSCVNQSVYATVTFSPNNYTPNFVWSISPGATTVALNAPQSSQVGITYTSCGSHTLSIVGYSAGVPSCTSNLVVNVICNTFAPVPMSVSPTNASVCPGFSVTLTASGANSCTWYPGGIVQPTISAPPGNYTVVCLNSIGCRVQETVAVAANPPLTIGVFQSASLTCITNNYPMFSNPIKLTASGAGTYAWFPTVPGGTNSTITVRPAANTCYTVIGSTSTCSGSAVACVTVVPQFTIGLSANSFTICKGDTYTVGISFVGASAAGPPSAFTYSWTEAVNAPPISISNYFTQSVTVYPKNTTTYTVEMWDASYCASAPQQVSVTVNPCTGVDNESELIRNSNVFPNPVRDKLYITSTRQGNPVIEVSDLTGRVYLAQIVIADNIEKPFIHVADLPAGIYLVKVTFHSTVPEVIRVVKD
jgi:hypothetical protein